jgi:hypothetical protein
MVCEQLKCEHLVDGACVRYANPWKFCRPTGMFMCPSQPKVVSEKTTKQVRVGQQKQNKRRLR